MVDQIYREMYIGSPLAFIFKKETEIVSQLVGQTGSDKLSNSSGNSFKEFEICMGFVNW